MPLRRHAASGDDHLRQAEALLKMAAGLGGLGAWHVDLSTGIVTFSDEVCGIHEVPPGFRCSIAEGIAFYAPEHRPLVRAAFEACVQVGQPYDLELRLVTASGRQVWVRTIAEPVRDAHGQITCVRGAFQDITRQKAAAEANRLLAERLTMTLESLTEAFFILDRQLRFTYMNREGERVLRRRREEVLGQQILDIFPEARGTIFENQYESALATGRMSEFDAYYPPLDMCVEVRAYPSTQGLAVSFRDVSEHVRTRREIERLNAELEERVKARTAELQAANRDLEAFTSSIAHDLRAPMAAINGFAEALDEAEGANLGQRGRRYLDRIRRAGTLLDEMTEGLLCLAKLSRAAVQREPVDFALLAADVVAMLREQEPARDVTFIAPDALPVRADRVLVKHVLANLLGNAWKFTGGVAQARIELGVREHAVGERVIFVRDNGAGFDMDHAQRLFEPFCRLHDASRFKGTGVGLAIVQGIVSKHDGRIWAEARPGEGATFYFTLA